MSTKIMAACWHIQTSPTAKAVLISLADNANDAGHCWPSIATISTRTCLEKTTVIRAIKRLEEEGFLVADRGNGRHTTYTITVDQPAQPVAERHRLQSATGSTAPPNRLQSATQPVAECNTNRQEPSRTVRGTRFALTTLPDEWRAYCEAKRPDLDPAEVFENFSAHFTSEDCKKPTKKNWLAAWQQWVRKEFARPGRKRVDYSSQYEGAR